MFRFLKYVIARRRAPPTVIADFDRVGLLRRLYHLYRAPSLFR